jgi:hypothetical protein
MSDTEILKLSNPRLIIVRELASGPKTHGALRIAYFGKGRAEGNTANTSFYNKLKQAVVEKLVKQDVVKGPYSLDVAGELMLAFIKKEKGDQWMTFLSAIKSEAQLKWEAEHPQA